MGWIVLVVVDSLLTVWSILLLVCFVIIIIVVDAVDAVLVVHGVDGWIAIGENPLLCGQTRLKRIATPTVTSRFSDIDLVMI